MSTTATRFGIVVGIDGSPECIIAVRWAAQEAQMRDILITLVYFLTPALSETRNKRVQDRIERYQRYVGGRMLDDVSRVIEECCGDAGMPAIKRAQFNASPVSGLAEMSKDAHMVVVGSRGLGVIASHALGSVSLGVVHHAHCPVAVVHQNNSLPPINIDGHIVVGIDGTRGSELATAIAFDEASRRGVGLLALHVRGHLGLPSMLTTNRRQREVEGNGVLAERLAGWQERYPDVCVTRRVASGRPRHRLIKESHRAQLVVIGSHGRGGFGRMLFGSVGSAVAHAARAPVIVAGG